MSDRPSHINRSGSTRRALLGRAAGLLVAAAVAVGGAAGAADQFVDGIEDLPLVAGLEPVPEAGVSYGTATGRIVQALARASKNRSDLTYEAVVAFYRDTLPQLGWDETGRDRWAREGEELTIERVSEQTALTVRFVLTPR